MKCCIVVGTRPEIIKMSPLIRGLQKKGNNATIVHTNQHYSPEMDSIFFSQLQLPDAHYHLDVGSDTHAKQTAKIMDRLDHVLDTIQPDIVLVEGDTNTVLGTSLVTVKKEIKLGHVEAGLRSYDRTMPEEINRVACDHISDHLYAPTKESEENLLKEGIAKEKIFITGNTIVDAAFQNLNIAEKKQNIFSQFNVEKEGYLLITAHRQENVDNKLRLSKIIKGISSLSKQLEKIALFPAHPRTVKMIKQFNLDIPKHIHIVNPVGFLEFLLLEKHASLAITDSGGVQEETCILQTPCITIRDNTERPETINVGSNKLVGTDPKKILNTGLEMHSIKKEWNNPYGNGKASEKIIKIMETHL